ncbi:Uncharacterized protein Rs2_04757 [Raphanus sativus]|nr:Uncharacterized protein Rs2_04757 [Raphanus sativus]
MSQWFTQLEDVAYSVVEYIPLVGTVYSLERAGIAYNERDWTRHWQSLGNFLESSVRDIILFKDIAEPTTVALIHTMAESLTDKLIEIYHHEPKRPEVKITQKLDKQRGHVLIAESSKGRSKEKSSEAKPRVCTTFTALSSLVRSLTPYMLRRARWSGLIFRTDCATGQQSPSRGIGLQTTMEKRMYLKPRMVVLN